MLPLKDDEIGATGMASSRRAVAAFLCAAFVAVVLWKAWLGDDAFVTFRTVDNFVNGYGLRWNVNERVQGFTHPLWAALLVATHFVTRDFFYTVYALSAACALAAAAMLATRVARTSAHAVLSVAILTLSHAVIEYSSSGLENTLTHLLLMLMAVAYFAGVDEPRRRFQQLAWLAGALTLNRMDTVCFALAPMSYCAFTAHQSGTTWRQLARDIALGFSPFILWTLFAITYYGFPFPNTAYAKLNTGIPATEVWYQGSLYLLSLLNSDPVSVLAILAALALAVRPGTTHRERFWMLGVPLYILYTVHIGGDFMQGRFYSAVVVTAVIGIARASLPMHTVAMQLGALGSIALVVVATQHPPPIRNATRGVSDERNHYARDTSLMSAKRTADMPNHEWARQGARTGAKADKAVTRNVIGLFGLAAGPRLHIVDIFALTDPLLARIPAKRDVEWRVGHFERSIPEGYLASIDSGQPRMKDRQLGRYYEALRTVISGPIWSWERWVRIWQLNTGALDHLIDRDRYRHPTLQRTKLEAVARPLRNGTNWDQKGTIELTSSGLEIALPGVRHDLDVEVSLDGNDRYEVVFMRGSWIVSSILIEPNHLKGLYTYRADVPDAAIHRGYDRIRVYPVTGKHFSLGHLLLR